MIYLYTGTPGSGKSYHQIEEIFKYLHRKKSVISNFPLKFSDRHKKKGVDKNHFYLKSDEITVDRLIEKSMKYNFNKSESNCLVCIDEAGIKFNSRDFSAHDRMNWINFFSQHRKLGYDVILTCQNDRMIDRQIRTLAEYEIKHRKVNNYGLLKFFPVTMFVYITYWYLARQRISSETSIYLKSIGDRYDTMALFNEV